MSPPTTYDWNKISPWNFMYKKDFRSYFHRSQGAPTPIYQLRVPPSPLPTNDNHLVNKNVPLCIMIQCIVSLASTIQIITPELNWAHAIGWYTFYPVHPFTIFIHHITSIPACYLW